MSIVGFDESYVQFNGGMTPGSLHSTIQKCRLAMLGIYRIHLMRIESTSSDQCNTWSVDTGNRYGQRLSAKMEKSNPGGRTDICNVAGSK